ncbi:hypothetical protein NEHOM01_0843 [Nematocida homosporus]|uniref:uncharacterized protein n=1 Tax=Nematocida homosporus TaxID=1912981 RepID=UPI00221FE2F8|nr:uncharacterized protein NEHOM01_0843 [Nematocida homosporus]KAI5185484.1 hypothetical protein NEHOM01_0843 [Nematocida homosporus]
MPRLRLKLVLVWLCCVMVRFGVVLGSSSDSNTNSDEMELEPDVEFWPPLAQALLEDSSCVEWDNFHLSGLDNFNSEMPEHRAQLERKRMTACLEWMHIMVQPLVGNRLIEFCNPDGSIGWILEMNSIEDRMRVVEDMQVVKLISYLCKLKETPGVCKVIDIYFCQTLKIRTNGFYIRPTPNPTPNPTSTNPNEKLTTYQQCLEALQPLKKITSPDRIRIVGETTENEMLDQLELLLFLLRIADSPTIEINWTDANMAPLDVKSVDRFRPLLEGIPAKLKKSELVIKIATSCNRELWDAFLKLVGEKYDIKTKHVRDYPVVSLNANST